MKITILYILFFVGLFSQEIILLFSRLRNIIIFNNNIIPNRVNNSLIQFITVSLPSFSFWFKFILKISILQILYNNFSADLCCIAVPAAMLIFKFNTSWIFPAPLSKAGNNTITHEVNSESNSSTQTTPHSAGITNSSDATQSTQTTAPSNTTNLTPHTPVSDASEAGLTSLNMGIESASSAQPNINITNPSVSLNTPNLKVDVSGVTDSLLAATAVRAGMEIAKSVPSAGGKIIAGSAAALAIGSAAKLGIKLVDQLDKQITKNSPSETNINNLMANSYLELFVGKVEGLDEYPLNLLTDISVLTSSAIVFVFLMLNVFVSKYLKNKNIPDYLPNWLNPNTNRLGKIFIYLIKRYINVWYNSRKFVLIFSWSMLLFCLLVIKLGLLIILGSK